MSLTVDGRRVLQLNGLTGITSGPILLLGAEQLASLFGLEQYAATVPELRVLGAGLAVFGALLFWLARRPVAPATLLSLSVIDAVWVAGSVGLLVSGALPLSVAGAWIVAVQADVIGIIAALEFYAWWSSRPARRQGLRVAG
jgi:membrane associated rhomboid family serine protease